MSHSAVSPVLISGVSLVSEVQKYLFLPNSGSSCLVLCPKKAFALIEIHFFLEDVS